MEWPGQRNYPFDVTWVTYLSLEILISFSHPPASQNGKSLSGLASGILVFHFLPWGVFPSFLKYLRHQSSSWESSREWAIYVWLLRMDGWMVDSWMEEGTGNVTVRKDLPYENLDVTGLSFRRASYLFETAIISAIHSMSYLLSAIY